MTAAVTVTVRTPYESPLLRDVTGNCIRPGGTELTDLALEFCRFPPGAKLLDVGCGSGGTVEHLLSRNGFDVAGVDNSRRLIADGLTRNPKLPLAVGRAEALTVADGGVDGIFCECVLSVLDEPCRALREFKRSLRPGGFLILSDLYLRRPSVDTDQRGLTGTAPTRGVMTRKTLMTLLEVYGFELRFWEDHTRLLQELAARLVLTHGSLSGLWCGNADTGCAGKRPGYYLLVARTER